MRKPASVLLEPTAGAPWRLGTKLARLQAAHSRTVLLIVTSSERVNGLTARRKTRDAVRPVSLVEEHNKETAGVDATPRASDGTPAVDNWTPRPYQQLVLDAFDRGIRRFSLNWHRRAGKDTSALHFTRRWSEQDIGAYWHLFPLHVQARRAIWRGINADGRRFLDEAFAPDIRLNVDNREMWFEMPWGSSWQMCGSDYYDRLVGSNVKGVVFSEFALCDPAALDYIRPIIRENGGWMMFITTFRGRNHAWQLAELAKRLSDWYVDIRDITQTTRHDGSPVITLEDVEKDRAEGMSEARIQEEYFCNPVAALEGAYYGRGISELMLRQAA